MTGIPVDIVNDSTTKEKGQQWTMRGQPIQRYFVLGCWSSRKQSYLQDETFRGCSENVLCSFKVRDWIWQSL